jgi:hypothetical protein
MGILFLKASFSPLDDGGTMSITNRQWTFASLVLALLLAALFTFGGHYRSVRVLFLPLGFWLSLRREPEQMQVRPWLRKSENRPAEAAKPFLVLHKQAQKVVTHRAP